MVVKDLVCADCESVRESPCEQDQTADMLQCAHCRRVTLHESRCTGGIKLKPYICSYDGRDWSGDIEHLGIEATYEDGTPVTERDGSRTDSKYRSDFDARVESKRDRKRSDARRKRGDAKIFVDQKQRSTPGR